MNCIVNLAAVASGDIGISYCQEVSTAGFYSAISLREDTGWGLKQLGEEKYGYKRKNVYRPPKERRQPIRISKKTGTTRQTINSYIHGRHQMRLEAIVLIASALHVSVDYLLGLNEKEEVASQQYLDVWALSKNLKEILNNRELGKEKFAKEIKITTSTLYQILKGNRLPSIDTFCRIVRVLNVSADTLLNKAEGGIAA